MVDGAVVDKTTTAGIDVPAINTSGTATDVMTTAVSYLSIQIIISYVSITSTHAVIIYVAT